MKRPMALYVYVKYLLILAGANFCVLKNEILRAKGRAFNRSSGRRIVVHSRGGPQWGCLLGNQTRFADSGIFHARLVSELPSEHKKIPRTEVLGII